MVARVYKHCVVGHGLIGTAACKYLAKQGEDVVLVGPSEGKGVHGACYDEGRIYRILDPMESWALLAEKSIERYSSIAEESGVDFFQESGLLVWGVNVDFIKQTKQTAAKMGTQLLEMTPADLSHRFPWLSVPASTQLGLLQTAQAGHLSPRKLNAAQLKLALTSGADYVDTNVRQIEKRDDHFEVTTTDGVVLAENVLVAAGVYTSMLPLLPEEVVVSLNGSQCLLVEISEASAARLADMPSMIYEGETEEDCFYILPPIKYPDGSWLLKLGPSNCFAPPLHTIDEVDAWFKRGHLDPDFEAKATAAFRQLFAGVEIVSKRFLLCVTDNTPHHRAYIDYMSNGWGTCTGGNGWAAKSADQIGYLASQMMTLPEHWTPDPTFPREWFRAVTPNALVPSPKLETAIARVEACGAVTDLKAKQALGALTAILAAAMPRLMQARVAERLQEELTALWGEAPTVVCGSFKALAPSHPFVALSAGSFNVLIIVAN